MNPWKLGPTSLSSFEIMDEFGKLDNGVNKPWGRLKFALSPSNKNAQWMNSRK
jgi:hypothetical protein